MRYTDVPLYAMYRTSTYFYDTKKKKCQSILLFRVKIIFLEFSTIVLLRRISKKLYMLSKHTN